MRTGNYEASDRNSVGTAITFLLVGIGAGALVALLLAPKPGKQLRKDLRRGYKDAVDSIQDLKEQAIDRVEDALDRGSEIADTIREKAAPLGRALRRS
jgi:gas vesicle protein